MMSPSDLTQDGRSIPMLSVSDFRAVITATQPMVAASLARIFGSEAQELYLLSNSNELAFREGATAEAQYIDLSLRFTDESEIAKILIGWCLLAYARAQMFGLDDEALADFVPVAFIANKAWRSAFLSEQVAATYSAELQAWRRLSPMDQLKLTMETGQQAPLAPHDRVPSLQLPWPFADQTLSLFDLLNKRIIGDLCYDDKVIACLNPTGHCMEIPHAPDALREIRAGTWMAVVIYRGAEYRFRVYSELDRYSIFRYLPMKEPGLWGDIDCDPS